MENSLELFIKLRHAIDEIRLDDKKLIFQNKPNARSIKTSHIELTKDQEDFIKNFKNEKYEPTKLDIQRMLNVCSAINNDIPLPLIDLTKIYNENLKSNMSYSEYVKIKRQRNIDEANEAKIKAGFTYIPPKYLIDNGRHRVIIALLIGQERVSVHLDFDKGVKKELEKEEIEL